MKRDLFTTIFLKCSACFLLLPLFTTDIERNLGIDMPWNQLDINSPINQGLPFWIVLCSYYTVYHVMANPISCSLIKLMLFCDHSFSDDFVVWTLNFSFIKGKQSEIAWELSIASHSHPWSSSTFVNCPKCLILKLFL